ncbi:unnamed protein product [Cuscuta campestris]|uniref:MBD domain-containing protein n=1 Tax=Cuscuta campestris TaxID=132261 RepID=A0A484MR89_9ASTE|nr:unnamed protein product [Cuscuta campestris]
MAKRKSKRKPPRTGNRSSSSESQLAVAAAPAAHLVTNTGFSLPAGWRVEEVIRSDRSKFDRYYYEPETGAKFRSLKDVERHVNGEEVSRVYRSSSDNHPEMLKWDEEEQSPNHWAIVPSEREDIADTNQLPDGWRVEEVPRATGSYKDKYYYEPGTGMRFRSMASVQRHLSELNRENAPLSKMFKLHHNAVPRSKASREEPLFGRTPSKVNWVLANHKGDAWNPFIGDTLVSDSVKEKWIKRFMSYMDKTS